jgi:tetrapyrrole methylase family protein/MazG family protein
LPALLRAFRISERAARTGFDWQDAAGVIEKVEEEWAELKSAIESGDGRQADQEFGDLLFTLVNLARFIKIHPETSLSDATAKFAKRFKILEKMAGEKSGAGIEALSLQQLDEIWEAVKRRENQNLQDI